MATPNAESARIAKTLARQASQSQIAARLSKSQGFEALICQTSREKRKSQGKPRRPKASQMAKTAVSPQTRLKEASGFKASQESGEHPADNESQEACRFKGGAARSALRWP